MAQSGPSSGGSSGAAGATAGAAGTTTGGSAGAAGAIAGAAGTTAGGAAGAAGASLCAAGQTETPTKICFHPDGTTRDPITYPTGAAMDAVYPACATMQRAATDACPPSTAVCNWGACGLKQVRAEGPPTKEGDDCCYAGALCYGPDACGRPLLVDDRPRIARLVVAVGWS